MPELKRDLGKLQADCEIIKHYADANPEHVTEPLLGRVDTIKQALEIPLRNNKTGLLKADACKYFNVEINSGVVTWHDDDAVVICKSLAYDWQKVRAVIPSRIGIVENELRKYGRSYQGGYGNFELVNKICSDAGLVSDRQGSDKNRDSGGEKSASPDTQGSENNPRFFQGFQKTSPDTQRSDTAQKSAIENRKQNSKTFQEKQITPKIGSADAQPVADRADLTAPTEPITFEAPAIGTAFLASGMQFVLYKPSEAYQKPERQSIIKNYFYADTITMLYGQAGSYKTFFAIWEGVSLVLGKTLCGMEIEPETAPQKVLYISLEMSAKDISDRLTRMTIDLTEAERQKIEDNFSIISAEDTANMKASNDAFISALEQLCTSEGYNVIYLDSFADYTAGFDVRSEGDMTSVIDALRTFTLKNHVSFRIIHHGTKPTQDANGSMAGIHTIRDLVDNVYLIKATDTKEVTVTSDMQKDRSAKSRHGEPITLLLQFVSDAETFSFRRIQVSETIARLKNVRLVLDIIEENQGIGASELREKCGKFQDYQGVIDDLVRNGSIIIDTVKSTRGSSKKCHYTADYWNMFINQNK